MLISIVINNYNYARYLGACIDSCLNQDYQQKEIIVVDDGSLDGSAELIRSYGENLYPIFKSNGGQASALNAGFLASSGEVVLFLDSDDMLFPNCLQQIADSWRRNLSKLHFNLSLIDGNGEFLGENYSTRPLPHGDLRATVLDRSNYVSPPTSGNAFARRFLKEVMPISPESEWRGAADAFLFNLAPLYGEVEALDEPLGCYRLHAGNLSSHLSGNRFDISKCRVNIEREVRTEALISRFADKLGYRAKAGALTRSYPHLQLKMIHDKLARRFGEPKFGAPHTAFFEMSCHILSFRGASLFKMICIHAYMAAILIVPAAVAERLTVFGYRNGAILFVRRPRRQYSPNVQ